MKIGPYNHKTNKLCEALGLTPKDELKMKTEIFTLYKECTCWSELYEKVEKKYAKEPPRIMMFAGMLCADLQQISETVRGHLEALSGSRNDNDDDDTDPERKRSFKRVKPKDGPTVTVTFDDPNEEEDKDLNEEELEDDDD